MRELRLKPKETPEIPIEAEVITPSGVVGRTLHEIRSLKVYVGNETRTLGDYFEISGETVEEPKDQSIIIEGDVPDVKYIGAGMAAGRVLVEGCIGMHAGSQMSGGELIITGDASNWAGAEMKGGLMRIHGNAGHQLAAAYRGSSEGMKGGCIAVGGSVGLEAGAFMRRGMIVIQGDVDHFAGSHMKGGEMFIFGRAARRLGVEAEGNGGFIACLGEVEEILPTYIQDTVYSPTMMRLYLKQIAEKLGISKAMDFINARFRRYRGDLAVGGNGEILVAES